MTLHKDSVELEFDSTLIMMRPTFNATRLSKMGLLRQSQGRTVLSGVHHNESRI